MAMIRSWLEGQRRARGRPGGTAGQILLELVTTGDYNRGMKAVGVKQLKARLSEYLRLVKTGETVLITDRDEVVAELRPARRRAREGQSVEERLQALADAGEITRPSLPKGDWTWKVKGLGLPRGTADRLLDEIRGDRV
jgi:antitoxin (DNA-binding transcriptional repressor) of toxin-antitoxin stability system